MPMIWCAFDCLFVFAYFCYVCLLFTAVSQSPVEWQSSQVPGSTRLCANSGAFFRAEEKK